MPVLKRQHAERYAKDAVVLDLADIAQQAEALRRAAQQQADRIIAEAKAERERLLSDAAEVGRREGHAEGLAQGREAGKTAGETEARAEHADQLRQLQAAWADALGEFLSQRDHLVIECKQDVLRLALTIAERITHRQIDCDEEVVCRQIEEALRAVGKPSRVVIAVSPDEIDLVREVLPDLAGRIEAAEHSELVADASLSPGSCRIRTAGGGEIDAAIETQLRRIVETIIPGGKTERLRASGELDTQANANQADADDGETDQRGELAA